MTRLSWPEGWLKIERVRARFELVNVTHPSTNRARHRITVFIETIALLLHQTTTTWVYWLLNSDCRLVVVVVIVISSSLLKVGDRGPTHQFSQTLPVLWCLVHSTRVLPVQSVISLPYTISLVFLCFLCHVINRLFKNVSTEVLRSDHVAEVPQFSLPGSYKLSVYAKLVQHRFIGLYTKFVTCLYKSMN